MQIKKLLVTGEEGFLYRYHFLVEAISQYVKQVETLPSGNFSNLRVIESLISLIYRITYKISLSTADRLFQKNKRAFIAKSRQTEAKIKQLGYKPDLVLHIFSKYCPIWDNNLDIPYAMYLDYTMALAIENWSPWAPFLNDKEREDWLECERQAYQKATHLFTMSEQGKTSLKEDYDVPEEKITVVGSAGNFQFPYEGKKTFGSQQILFNGSDFERKGGDLVLKAFPKVREALPNSQLVIIGKKILTSEPGIINPGRISSRDEMRELFLNSDLVVAPSRCEPFQEFLLEALNYGVPCLVSDKDGMPEIIDDQVDGIVIREMDAEVFANKIIELLSDSSKLISMSKQARKKIKYQLNWNKIAVKMLQKLAS
ncbi:glycosyltransferase family 4 protein [Oscillatoria salina]|uniref:glycosyltransferase family 4 protein n=1 Tax=Oscillatoria salina TaxID=331517 RepID=UPI0013BDD2E0|nr:glycosyltransferase family 4 protein [Oscillatoria salina]MBZ8179104.1 glycosyltransferase family 4 protein [Oscillatoria salina IIICB1]NET87023.1 glycosyltransferase family 4 protein [Kamptonema sp. SIO1D9]